ncbi:MAG: U32 family peptidase [Prevotella sp.]|nr:U32 family peptidase [Prevotella sp.]
MRKIELLAPAKDLECGKAAIDHGADAVYIGAQRFGARVAAGNSVDDIGELCQYAHQFGAKVYVTVNTIVYDNEMEKARDLLRQLAAIGVDAVLVQDMGLVDVTTLEAPSDAVGRTPTVFHASTQTDNRTKEKVAWLRSQGFSRVVLARELTIDEIREIHEAVPDVELEVFVHGALCVSFSGLCYASEHCFGRSANRGECAQFCRMKFDLEDADGQVIERGRHLLSLKDLCQIDRLEELLEAGAVSLKIEGRLKDVSYVKNVTAAYSQRLNEIIERHPDRYQRASLGRCTYSFEPNLKKTFNRGFTHYFLDGRQPDIFSPDTPKAIGEYVGRVKELSGRSFNVAGTAAFANGDGLCFLNDRRELEGFRVNRAEGNRLFPLKMPASLRPGMALYRNNDVAFERLMSGKTAERKIAVAMTLEATAQGFRLSMAPVEDIGLETVSLEKDMEKQTAQKSQRENIVRQLSKLGNTPYECTQVTLVPADFGFFIPSSALAEMRREMVEKAMKSWSRRQTGIIATTEHPAAAADKPEAIEWGRVGEMYARHTYLYNVANQKARAFYEERGLKTLQPAFELGSRQREPLIMQCRHCLRYSLGYCRKQQEKGAQRTPWCELLYLKLSDGRRFRLEFDCKSCQMNIYAAPRV